MAVSGTLFTPSRRRPATAEQSALFTAEQRRLKAGAASRREAAATQVAGGSPATAWSLPENLRRSRRR